MCKKCPSTINYKKKEFQSGAISYFDCFSDVQHLYFIKGLFFSRVRKTKHSSQWNYLLKYRINLNINTPKVQLYAFILFLIITIFSLIHELSITPSCQCRGLTDVQLTVTIQHKLLSYISLSSAVSDRYSDTTSQIHDSTSASVLTSATSLRVCVSDVNFECETGSLQSPGKTCRSISAAVRRHDSKRKTTHRDLKAAP